MSQKNQQIDQPKSSGVIRLIESIIHFTLELAVEETEGRKRVTANLHPLATRAMFRPTEEHFCNADLLRVLRPKTASGVVGRDTREVRFLRSFERERGLKIGDLRRSAISLLMAGRTSKADVVHAWVYAIIHHAAKKSVREFRSKYGWKGMDWYWSNPEQWGLMVNKCYQLTFGLAKEDLEKADPSQMSGRPDWAYRRFLHICTLLVLDEMQVDRPSGES